MCVATHTYGAGACRRCALGVPERCAGAAAWGGAGRRRGGRTAHCSGTAAPGSMAAAAQLVAAGHRAPPRLADTAACGCTPLSCVVVAAAHAQPRAQCHGVKRGPLREPW